ncbi:unnamed protein product, partial [Brenthis ino]
MVPIFIKKNGIAPYENLVHHTKLNISFDDGGSELICRPCSEELEILVKFLNKCFRANELFATCKQNSIGPTKSDKDASKSDTDSNKLIINEDSIPSENEHVPNMSIQTNSTKKKMYTCQCCHKAFTRHGNLKLHLNRHNGEREHHCIKCGAGVLTRALARQHCAPRVRRPCPTPGCAMTFLSPYSLKVHIRKHNGEMPFECADCHKKFRCKNTLRDHTKIHSGVKSYICPICGKQFATNKLSTHMRTHAPNAHACAACARDFPSARALALHAATHAPRARAHACHVCTATYNHRQSLNKHIRKMHSETTTQLDSADQPTTL